MLSSCTSFFINGTPYFNLDTENNDPHERLPRFSRRYVPTIKKSPSEESVIYKLGVEACEE